MSSRYQDMLCDYMQDHEHELIMDLWENNSHWFNELVEAVITNSSDIMGLIVDEIRKNPKMSEKLDSLLMAEAESRLADRAAWLQDRERD